MQYRQGGLAAIPQLEGRTDEQLLSESKHRAAARAILGARAVERYDAKEARRFYNEAMVGAHPQERPALRQMMNASLALAERRPDDLRDAVQKLGQEPPTSRQLLLLRFMGLVAPAPGAERAVSATLALLLDRERGMGAGYAEVALSEAAAFFAEPLRYGITKPGAHLGGGFPGYGLYEARDGWVAVAALEAHFWERLLLELGLEEATREDLEEVFLQKPAEEWEQWATERDLPLKAVSH